MQEDKEFSTESEQGYAEGLEVLPRRIFLEGDREPVLDPDGFDLPIGEKLTPKDLLEQAAVLAVAPPWAGKTFVAEALYRALKPWKPEALGKPPEPRSNLEAWQKALQEQAELFEAQFQEVQIEPFVMDLRWSSEDFADL